MLRGPVTLIFQNIAHNEDNVFHKQSVGVSNLYLSTLSGKTFVYMHFYLIKKNGIHKGIELLTQQFFNMFLYLRTELFIIANKKFKKIPNESKTQG